MHCIKKGWALIVHSIKLHNTGLLALPVGFGWGNNDTNNMDSLHNCRCFMAQQGEQGISLETNICHMPYLAHKALVMETVFLIVKLKYQYL